MAFPDFLLAGWQDNVRALCGGVSTDDVPDSMLSLDSYGPASEDRIKELVPVWATFRSTKNTGLNRTAIRHVAAKVCDYCKIKFIKQSERIGGEYEYTMAKIDWPGRKLELMAEFYDFLGDLDPGSAPSLVHIDKIERDPPIYEDIDFE